MRLLLVEDDPLLGDGIRAGLGQDDYSVDWFSDARSAEMALQSEQYDLMVLDIGLPDKSGLKVLEQLRRRGDRLPVLILTARDAVSDRITGLDSGADDYMIKPFDLDELSARLRALLRRSRGRASSEIRHGDIVLDPAAHRVTQNGSPVDLSPREYAVLHLLLENIGRVISRSRLEEDLYSWDGEVESNAIEVYIHHLRRKLGSELIRTIRGVGYIIDPR
ncbi:MAG: response regulator [Gammaproteobacteria bacterium]|nr:response regulator [Gammaproteobacteria bacterium]MCW8841369.1 response regulator [Gammaproteobacteria bacterium]MCW8927620.1 response regulator [Gammaproteobacteria bacterium]MCW8957456.1 response regulator [Gammaproteobacteria bacterium]MCW8972877.1 response regulator [Gammaproteobacteria bacterium]